VTAARVAVLASGGGSNLGALFAHLDRIGTRARWTIALVASDRADAGALARATTRGAPTAHIARPLDAVAISALLEEHAVDLVVLAGYLRLVPSPAVRAFRGRILNVHPAMLPSFGGQGMYGRRVHEAVLQSGTRLSGATVHFVDEAFDRGPIIAQWPVPVLHGDTVDALAGRVLGAEHLLLPAVVDAVASGNAVLDDAGSVRVDDRSPWLAPAFTASAAPHFGMVSSATPVITLS